MPDFVDLNLDVQAVTVESVDGAPIELDLIDAEAVTIEYVDGEVTLEVIGEVGPRGLQGIQGEVGPAGPPSLSFYRHHQTSASDTWLIEHDLFYPPSVTIVDSAGTVLLADVFYIDDFHIQVTFSAPTAGYAYCT